MAEWLHLVRQLCRSRVWTLCARAQSFLSEAHETILNGHHESPPTGYVESSTVSYRLRILSSCRCNVLYLFASMRHTWKISSAFFTSLPIELLSHIFVLASYSLHIRNEDPLSKQRIVAISRVCRYGQHVARSTWHRPALDLHGIPKISQYQVLQTTDRAIPRVFY